MGKSELYSVSYVQPFGKDGIMKQNPEYLFFTISDKSGEFPLGLEASQMKY